MIQRNGAIGQAVALWGRQLLKLAYYFGGYIILVGWRKTGLDKIAVKWDTGKGMARAMLWGRYQMPAPDFLERLWRNW